MMIGVCWYSCSNLCTRKRNARVCRGYCTSTCTEGMELAARDAPQVD